MRTIRPIVRYMKNSSGDISIVSHEAPFVPTDEHQRSTSSSGRQLRAECGPLHAHISQIRSLSYRIGDGISNSGLGKSLPTNEATIASPASQRANRIVATVSEFKRHAQLDPLPDDLSLGAHQQRRPYLEHSPFRSRFRSFVHRGFKRTDESWSAVGIAGVVENVRAEVNDGCPHHLPMCRCKRKEDEVSSWHIGH